MKFIPMLAAAAVLSQLAGCTRIEVSADRDPSYDFSRIYTYQWIEPPGEEDLQQLQTLNGEPQTALENELAAHGWKRVSAPENATVQIAHVFTIDAHREYAGSVDDRESAITGGLAYDSQTRSWSYAERDTEETVYVVETGTLRVLIYDTATGKRIWRGTVVAEIDRSRSPEERMERYRRIAGELLKKLPKGQTE